MEEDTSLVWRKSKIIMQEGTSLVWRNAFYLDSLNINDLTLPNSTWLYLDPANSNEHILLMDINKVMLNTLEIRLCENSLE